MQGDNLKIKDAYDIAMAFIKDKGTSVKVVQDVNGTYYEFTKNFNAVPYTTVYTMVITMPRGLPETKLEDRFNHSKMAWEKVDVSDKKCGKITLSKGRGDILSRQMIMSAKTDNNVSLADEKKRSDAARAFTRVRSSRFFKLLNQAQKRSLGKLPTCDNTSQLFMLLYRLENANQR